MTTITVRQPPLRPSRTRKQRQSSRTSAPDVASEGQGRDYKHFPWKSGVELVVTTPAGNNRHYEKLFHC